MKTTITPITREEFAYRTRDKGFFYDNVIGYLIENKEKEIKTNVTGKNTALLIAKCIDADVSWALIVCSMNSYKQLKSELKYKLLNN